MVKNGFKVIVYHISLSFGAIFLMSMIGGLQANEIINTILFWTISISFYVFYIYIGIHNLSDLGSKSKNLLSIFSLTVFLIILWGLCFLTKNYDAVAPENMKRAIALGINKAIYCIVLNMWLVYPFLHVIDYIYKHYGDKTGDITLIFLSIIPTILIYIGFLKKSKKEQKAIM